MKIRKPSIARGPRHHVLALAIAGLVSACGGGGGGDNVRPVSPPPAAPPPPAPPVVFPENPAYGRHLDWTNARAAHDAGLTGQGIRIGVVDTGINSRHPALYPRVVANLVYIGANGNDLGVDDKIGHGTAVAQAMAGAPFGAWPGGVAPGVELISARIISDEPPEDDGSGQGNEIDGPLGLAGVHQDLINRGARIMNNSWGGLYWTNPNVTAQIAGEYRPFIVGNDGLVVFATGNESFANPSDMAALPSQPGPNGSLPAADLERGWLAVAALDADDPNALADYSNACGVAMRYCLVAPGTVIVTGTNDGSSSPSYYRYSGTSLATPLVSGAAALVWEAFPYFDNDLVRQTLLGTATDLGAPGVDAVFGYGRLDIGKAIAGPARLDWGDVDVSFSGESHWRNDIGGAGGITKRGTGTLVLDGANTYAGNTRVLAGTLRAGGVPGAAVVGTQGHLQLHDARIGGDVSNDGELAISGSAGWTTTVAGDFSQSAGGTLGLLVGSPLAVDGSAQLDGELRVDGIASGYVHGSRELMLSADGGIAGRFATLGMGPGVFLEGSLDYTALEVFIDIQRLDVSAATMGFAGASASSLSAADRIERAFRWLDAGMGDGGVAGTGVVDAGFLDMAGRFQRTAGEAAAIQSLESLSGDLHAADAGFVAMAVDGSRHALEARLDAMHGTAADGGAWGDALYARRVASRFDLDADGWLLGQDARDGGLTAGIAFGELDGTAWNAARGDRERNRLVEGQAYAQWTRGNGYLLGRIGSGRLDRRMQRNVILGGQAFALDSDYAARYATASLQAGWRFDAAGVALTPYLGLQSVRLGRDGFDEPGAAGFGLSSRDATLRADQAIAGLRVGHDWALGGLRLGLAGRAEWQRLLSQSGGAIDARFTGIDIWSPIVGAGLDGEAGTLGLSLSLDGMRWGGLGLGLDGRRVDGDTQAHGWVQWSKGF